MKRSELKQIIREVIEESIVYGTGIRNRITKNDLENMESSDEIAEPIGDNARIVITKNDDKYSFKLQNYSSIAEQKNDLDLKRMIFELSRLRDTYYL